MGHRELITSLQEKGDELVLRMRKEAEEKASRIRADASARREAMTAAQEERRQKEASRLTSGIMAEAGKEAQRMRLEALQRLSERLLRLAPSLLPEVGADDRGRTFNLLAGEASPGKWQTVRVNPSDRERAARTFPGRDIVCTPGISGGFVLESEEGDIRFDNTLEKRLERAWPQLFSLMVREEGLS